MSLKNRDFFRDQTRGKQQPPSYCFSPEWCFVSDVHLVRLDSARGELFCKKLRQISQVQSLKKLILVGDIFDFNFAATSYFRNKFEGLYRILQEFLERGVAVHFVQGNHEYAMDKMGLEGIKVTMGRELLLSMPCGRKVAITHGDRLQPSWLYRNFIYLKETWIFRNTAMLLPQASLDKLALSVARQSRARDDSQKVNHRKNLQNGFEWLQQTGADIGVLGHFHQPYGVSRKQGTLLCLEDWSKPNFLLYGSGRFWRTRFGGCKTAVHPVPLRFANAARN